MLYKWKVRALKIPRLNILWRRWRARRGDAIGSYDHLPAYIRKHAPGRTFADIGCMWGVNGEYAFLAEEAGATAVKAVDVFGPTHLPEEIAFWDDYLRTGGLQWPDEFARRADPRAPLVESEILTRLPDRDPVRILDVGAGPMTVLGRHLPGREVEVVAVDPLARHYDELLDRYGIAPPVRTLACEGESLVSRFGEAAFDFAYARNALDHAYDPRRVIRQMIAVVEPGGWVILRHRPNEAETAGYEGLHRWNFDEREGMFWISDRSYRYNMTSVIGSLADIACARDGEWLVCAIRKLPAGQRARPSGTGAGRTPEAPARRPSRFSASFRASWFLVSVVSSGDGAACPA